MAKGPFDALVSGDWVDLSDRVRGVSRRAGREDQTAEFAPATVSVTLDNSDRLLDPDYPAALNYRHAGLGMPLCPVRISLDYDGSNHPLFRGYLGPECWEGVTAAHGPEATVVLNAFDRHGLFAQLTGPGGIWPLMISYLGPDWWVDGAAGFPFLNDGSELPNKSWTGGAATVSADPSEIVALIEPSLDGRSVVNLSMWLGEQVEVVSPAARVMPAGSTVDGTAMVFWQGSAAASTQKILRMESSSGVVRWQVACSPSGEIACSIHDAAGTVLDLVSAAPNPNDGAGRWDDGRPHMITVRIVGGDHVDLFVDGAGTVLDSPPLDLVRPSNLIAGGSDEPTVVDEILWWNRALSDGELSVPTIFFGTGRGPFRGDSMTQRLAHLYQAFGIDPAGDETEWHTGTEDSTLGATGMSEMSDTTSGAPFSTYLADTVASWGGVIWATRAGQLRARSITALWNPAHEAHYQTPTAHLTDEPSPALDPLPVRRGVVTFSGVRGDRIVNEATVSFGYGVGGGFTDPSYTSLTFSDVDSIARYGPRSVQMETSVFEWPWAALLAKTAVERSAEPPVEIQAITLYPLATSDSNALEWLVTRCELERAVLVTHSPAVGDPVTHLLQVQGEAWDWDGMDLRVTLSLATS